MSAITPEQVRAGRGWLGWTQDDLAKRASVGLSTVRDFENGKRTPIPNNLAALQRALEEAGIGFQFNNGGIAAGVTGPSPTGLRMNASQQARAARQAEPTGIASRGRHGKPSRHSA